MAGRLSTPLRLMGLATGNTLERSRSRGISRRLCAAIRLAATWARILLDLPGANHYTDATKRGREALMLRV